MEAVCFYLAKMIICSGVMFLYYKLSLKDKTFHHYNRFYLLSAMVISILLPLIKLEDFTIEVSDNLFVLLSMVQNYNTSNTINNEYIYFTIILTTLGLVSLYFLGKFIYGISRIHHLKTQFERETFGGVNFYQTNLSEAPFSFFKNIFWKNSILINSEIGRQILKHEMVHIEQKHSIDKIFVEVITSIFWFNPFFYIIKKEINLIHEYLADKKAVKNSDTKAFAQMLLASHFSGNSLPATSPFLSSTLKKRLKMLQKPKTKFGYARRIFALPVLFILAFTYMVNAKNKEIKETNKQINKAVAELKKDTISPSKSQTEKIINLQEEKLSKTSESLKKQAQKLKTISQDAKEKAKELQKIAKEHGEKSYEFELKAKELKQLSKELDKIDVKEPFFGIDVNDIIKDKVLLDKDENIIIKKFEIDNFSEGEKFKIKINGKDVAFGEVPNSNGKMSKTNRIYIDGGDAIIHDKNYFPMPPQNHDVRVERFFDSRTNIPPKELSKKELKKLEKLKKERIEVEKKLKEIKKQQRELQNDPWMISVEAHEIPSYSVNATYVESNNSGPNFNSNKLSKTSSHKESGITNFYLDDKDTSDKNTQIIINGKDSSREEMKKINSKNIKDISIKKNKVNGVESNKIIINTKKDKPVIN